MTTRWNWPTGPPANSIVSWRWNAGAQTTSSNLHSCIAISPSPSQTTGASRKQFATRAGRLKSSRTAKSGRGDQSLSLGIIAISLRSLGDLQGALAAVQESRRIQEQLARGGLEWENYNLALALQREGSILGEEGEVNLDRPAEAEADFQKARRIMRDLANESATDSSARYFFALLNQSLGDIIRHRDPAQALALYDEAWPNCTRSRTATTPCAV